MHWRGDNELGDLHEKGFFKSSQWYSTEQQYFLSEHMSNTDIFGSVVRDSMKSLGEKMSRLGFVKVRSVDLPIPNPITGFLFVAGKALGIAASAGEKKERTNCAESGIPTIVQAVREKNKTRIPNLKSDVIKANAFQILWCRWMRSRTICWLKSV